MLLSWRVETKKTSGSACRHEPAKGSKPSSSLNDDRVFFQDFFGSPVKSPKSFFLPNYLALDDTFPCYLEVYAALRNAIFLVDEAMAASEFKSQALQKLTAGTVPIKLGGLDQSCECFSPFPVGGVLFSGEPAFFKHFVGGEFLQPCEVVPLVGSLSGQLQVLFGWSNHATLGSEVGWRCPLTYYFSYMFFRKNSVTFANFYPKTSMFCQWFYMMFTFYHVLEIGNFNFQECRHPVRLSGGIFYGCNLQHEWNQPEELSLGWYCKNHGNVGWLVTSGKICFAMVLRVMNSESCSNSLRLGPFVSRRPVATEQCHGAQRRLVPGVPFLPCETFQATFNSRWPPEAPGIAAIAAGGSKTSVFLSAFFFCYAFQTEVYQPWRSKDHSFFLVSPKRIFFSVGIYNQHFQQTIIFNGQFDFQGINFSGETLGDLASAVEYASDAAIGKLLKDTERYLERAAAPFAALREGLQLSSNGKEATVLKARGVWGLLGKNIINCKFKLVFFWMIEFIFRI